MNGAKLTEGRAGRDARAEIGQSCPRIRSKARIGSDQILGRWAVLGKDIGQHFSSSALLPFQDFSFYALQRRIVIYSKYIAGPKCSCKKDPEFNKLKRYMTGALQAQIRANRGFAKNLVIHTLTHTEVSSSPVWMFD